MNLRYTTLDVFTDRPFGGNPLAVFCDPPELSTERMQAIAREFNLWIFRASLRFALGDL